MVPQETGSMVSEDGESESEIVFNLLFKYSVQWRIQGGGGGKWANAQGSRKVCP